jgi:NADH-quinone oxidoreductase subunit A
LMFAFTLLLFYLLFDLEVAFLFPWVLVFNSFTTFFEYYAVILFLGVLLAGFYYEWQKGALDWE